MKKILAVMMAIVMMMAIAVPAFAGTITQDPTASDDGSATVKTSTANITGEGTFTLSYPAAMIIDWEEANNANYNYSYSVTSNLKTGYCVEVTIDGGTNGFVMEKTGVTSKIPYTLTVDGKAELTAKTTKEVVAANEFVMPLLVAVDTADWKAASIDEYTDTITFTADIVALA